LKSISLNRELQPFFLQNSSGKPEIVLICPITRNEEGSLEKWGEVIDFVEKSLISTLLVIDKTAQSSATEFFMSNFQLDNKSLIVFPRSIRDTLFDSVGEITLDKNIWVIQTHDDDSWSGNITLPDYPNPNTVYFSDFYLNSDKKGTVQIKDYAMPNRIVFSLVPSKIWNRFTKLVQDQHYHVAGSFDFTLNFMAQLTCEFEYHSGFKYFWKNDNWRSIKSSIEQLTKLATNDGWEYWSSPEIANFNRTIDSLAALNYIKDLLEPGVVENVIRQLIGELSPSYKRKLKYGILIPTLYVGIRFRRMCLLCRRNMDQKLVIWQERLSLYRFIKNTWNIKSIENAIDLITHIELLGDFENLQVRFQHWKQALRELSEGM
jgi:hypothetical protein